jgi:hypothetical protein
MTIRAIKKIGRVVHPSMRGLCALQRDPRRRLTSGVLMPRSSKFELQTPVLCVHASCALLALMGAWSQGKKPGRERVGKGQLTIKGDGTRSASVCRLEKVLSD